MPPRSLETFPPDSVSLSNIGTGHSEHEEQTMDIAEAAAPRRVTRQIGARGKGPTTFIEQLMADFRVCF